MLGEELGEITLTPDELYALASALHLPLIVGLHDPFLGARAEDMAAHLDAARDRLFERGYLVRSGAGSLTPSPRVAEMLRLNAAASVTLAVSRTAHRTLAEVVLIHARLARFVAQATTPDAEVRLQSVSNPDRVVQEVLDHASIDDARPADGQPMTIPIHALEQLRLLTQDGDIVECDDVLQRAGVAKHQGDHLIGALIHEHTSGSFTVLRRGPRAITHGERLAWLIGNRGAWRAELSEGRGAAIRLTPTAGAAIRRRLRTIVLRAIE